MKTRFHFPTIIILLFSLFGLFSSCANQDELDDLAAIKEPLHSPANPDNPFDFVGIEHNRGLNHLGQFADTIINLVTIRKDSVVTINFMKEKLLSLYSIDYDLDSLGVEVDAAEIGSVAWMNPFDLVDSLNMSPNGEQHLKDVFSAAIAKEPKSSADVNDLAEHLIAIEGQVLADSTLADEERQTLLTSTSVFRHSLFFWNSLAFDDSAPWGKIRNTINGYDKTARWGWGEWLITAGSDALGAAFGCWAAGPVGGIIVGGIASGFVATHMDDLVVVIGLGPFYK